MWPLFFLCMTMIKQVILDILDFIRWQVINDRCTPEQLRSIHASLVEKITVEATAEDIADYFGKSKENVRNVLSRTPMPRPKRKTYYCIKSFFKFMPKTWKHINK